MSSSITQAEVDRIASIQEPVLRNLLITQCYSELSSAFSQKMGPVANWCTFATWASKQAGQTIRRQDLERSLEVLLQNEPEIETALSLVIELAKQAGAKQSIEQLRQSALGVVLSNIAAKAGDAVSRGNKKVFEEIAREFARFIVACFDDTVYDPSTIESFCNSLRPGPPPEGQDNLRKAFQSYYSAIFETSLQQKAELNLLANLQIGFHEQTRLQPEITEALNATFDEQQVKAKLINAVLDGNSFLYKIVLFIKRLLGKTRLLDKAIESLLQQMQHHLRRALTKHMMALTIPPQRRLQLGRDLSLTYPEVLKQLINTDLLELLRQTDPTPGSLLQSGADDWANLAERMHFICELFRCCHVSGELFEPAFSFEQIATLKDGRIPDGKL